MDPDDCDSESDGSQDRQPVWRRQHNADSNLNRVDVIFGALTDHRRRLALYYLEEEGGVGDFGSLVNQVASWERDQPIRTVSDEDRDRVKAEFHHSHLPKLEELGLVEYDQRSGAIRYADPPAILTKLLQLTKRFDK